MEAAAALGLAAPARGRPGCGRSHCPASLAHQGQQCHGLDAARDAWSGRAAGAALSPAAQPPAPLRRLACWRVHCASPVAHQQQDFELSVHRGYIPDAVGVSRLLAQAFVSSGFDAAATADDGAPLSRLQLVQYQLKMLGVLQVQAATLGRQMVTVVATDPGSGKLAGVANLAPGLTLAGVGEHLRLTPGQAAATLSSLAVAEGFRRRGLGRQLVAACEAAAAQYSPPAALMALAVYRYNDPALQLYQTSGYRLDDSWVDPRWAKSAESGRVGFARRQLMLKALLPR